MNDSAVPHVEKAIVQEAYDEGFDVGFRCGASRQPVDRTLIVSILSTTILIVIGIVVTTMLLMGESVAWVYIVLTSIVCIIAFIVSRNMRIVD